MVNKSNLSFPAVILQNPFLTCAYINFSKNIPILKNKEINMVDEKQRSYCFMDLQKEAYPQRFQQATETVVPLFSSHICFVLES